MQASLVFIRNLISGTAVVTGECSSNHSKRIYEKLEFDSLAEIMFEDYKVAGEIVMNNTGEHKSMRVYGKIV